jgi:hypothetical protein
VKSDQSLGTLHRVAEQCERDAAGVGGDDRVGCDGCLDGSDRLSLEGDVLRHCLHHQPGVGERRSGRLEGDPRQHVVRSDEQSSPDARVDGSRDPITRSGSCFDITFDQNHLAPGEK